MIVHNYLLVDERSIILELIANDVTDYQATNTVLSR
ncbi:hypothetical protein SKA34_11430 [Photobacterium sp. SKA34]|nr:hypothetical protein SKA34_11430 [Photobacterium sp. SKA34]